MKGVIFTEFTEMVEQRFGLESLDTIITSSDLPSKGAYTAVGTYDHHEMVKLVVALSKQESIPLPQLLEEFGTYLFKRFTVLYPHFFKVESGLLHFLESVEHYIHVEVFKLYPDAELPRFSCSRPSENRLVMIYQSDKSMADLAIGLIKGASAFFNENCTIMSTAKNETGSVVEIEIIVMNE
jgi:hypothetical protein